MKTKNIPADAIFDLGLDSDQKRAVIEAKKYQLDKKTGAWSIVLAIFMILLSAGIALFVIGFTADLPSVPLYLGLTLTGFFLLVVGTTMTAVALGFKVSISKTAEVLNSDTISDEDLDKSELRKTLDKDWTKAEKDKKIWE